MNLRALVIASLVVACASHPRPVTVVPPPAPAPVPRVQRTPDEALIDDLMREAETFVHPNSGPISARFAEAATARLDALAPTERPRLARPLLAWLIARAWGMNRSREAIHAALSVLGDAGYDTIADACDAERAPYGCTSLMLYTDPAGHDALLSRLLTRLRADVDAARGTNVTEGMRERVVSLIGFLEALDRAEPVHHALLAIAAEASAPVRLRVECIERMNRSDLPFVEPALRAIARTPGEVSVREIAVRRLGEMVDRSSAENIAALYDTTPAGAEGTSLRGAIGEAVARRLGDRARPRLIAWMRRAGPLRAGYDEADRCAQIYARGVLGREEYPGLRDPTAEGRALAILAWSWGRGDARLIEALTSDRARLTGSGWREHEVETVGALARWALLHRNRDIEIRFNGCCVLP